MAARSVKLHGKDVSLTKTEYELLRMLATNRGRVLTHRELLQLVWGPEYGLKSRQRYSDDNIFDKELAAVRQTFGETSFTQAWAEGQVLSLNQLLKQLPD